MAIYKVTYEVHQLDEYWIEWDGDHPPSDGEINDLVRLGNVVRRDEGVDVFQDFIVSVELDS